MNHLDRQFVLPQSTHSKWAGICYMQISRCLPGQGGFIEDF
jgi:hypothetical protein